MWTFLFFAFVFLLVVAFLKLNANSRAHDSAEISERISTGNDFRFPVVGEASYQSELRHAVSQEGGILPLSLVLDDTNPYDDQAVKVAYYGTTVGYLSRRDARALRRAISSSGLAAIEVPCQGKAFGGTPGKPTIGIWLNISFR